MSCPAGAAAPRPAGGVGPFGLRVNRWNQSVDVWRNPYSALTNERIGRINPNDFFRQQWSDDVVSMEVLHHHVLIRNFSGLLQWGYFTEDGITAPHRNLIMNCFTNFPRARFTWNGMNLLEYTVQNRSAQLRTLTGVLLENLPIGTRIGIEGNVMGVNWCAFIRIEAVRRFLPDLGWQWTWADLNAGLRGFVHTGLPANTPATSTLRTSLVP